MKQRIMLSFCLLFLAGLISAQSTIDLGIFNYPANSNKLEIRTKSTQAYEPGYLSGLVFTIRYPASYNVSLQMNVAPPFFVALTGQGTLSGYKYYSFSFGGGPFVVNWASGVEYVAGVVNIINEGGSGLGSFELVAQDQWTIDNNADFYVELNGVSNHRNFYQSSTAAPLPVELLSFQAKSLPNGSVGIDWVATSEHQLAYYEVEHSTDGRQFHVLGKEAARGEQNASTPYTYNHKSPQGGHNYYRLRMVGENGAFEFSPLRTVTLDSGDIDFSAFPTPTAGPLLLTSRNLEKYPDGLLYQLVDNTGRLIRTDQITDEKTNFDLSNEPSGTYFLNIRSQREQVAQFPVVLTNH